MNSPQLAVSSGAEGDSDEEMDWEEVSVAPVVASKLPESVLNYDLEASTETGPSGSTSVAEGTGNIEITLKKANKVDPKRKKQGEQNAEKRALRLTCHKIHTVTLLANALTRNKWINDPLLHARLLSLTPLPLQTAFTQVTKKYHPDVAMRGRFFELSITRLTKWWYEEFFEIEDDGHIRSYTFDQVQRVLSHFDFEDDDGEIIRSSKSLMKHALKRRGSRDVCSQLFTALCRALGIPARLVVSLQSVPWQASAGKPKPAVRKSLRKHFKNQNIFLDAESGVDIEDVGGEDDDDMEEVSIPEVVYSKGKGKMQTFPGEGQMLSGGSSPSLKGKEKALPKPVIKLRKSKSAGQRLGSSSSSRQSTPAPPIGGYPPVFWTEVFSRPDGKWLPVDPTRNIVKKRKIFEPPAHDKTNRMVYVVGVEEDGYCRDVTARYAKDYGTKTSKAQLGGKGRKDWWESIMALVTRPYRLLRDDVEDEEFEYNKYTEGMPTSVAGFKNHPLYALEQHVKRDEVIFPKTEIGKFRGEPVYPRSNIVPLKTAENWMRAGRRVKEGAQALKWVKQRAVTIHRRRAVELAQQDGDEMLQGLYSEAQTELYIPDPIVDGIIPKNDFGNIDLYTPSMLPAGAAHIPHKGAAKVAKRLGFNYAEAVTSFEFKKGHAFPVISGIVVASKNEEALLDAYWEAEREAEEKEQTKRKERVIKRWTRLIHGLRIRQRLQEQYANGGEPSNLELTNDENGTMADAEQPGGFLTEADSIVQPFHLPRYEHSIFQPTTSVGTAAERDEFSDKIGVIGHADLTGTQASEKPDLPVDLVDNDDDDDGDLEEILPTTNGHFITSAAGNGIPKSMRELAEESTARQMETDTTEYIGRPAKKSGNNPLLLSSSVKQPGITLMHSSERGSAGTVAPTTLQRKDKTSVKDQRRTRTTRKHKKPVSSEISELDENSNGDVLGDAGDNSGDDMNGLRQRNVGPSRSGSKRKRASGTAPTTPAPPTRVLRTRVPKNIETLKAEKEAEAAYRRAIED